MLVISELDFETLAWISQIGSQMLNTDVLNYLKHEKKSGNKSRNVELKPPKGGIKSLLISEQARAGGGRGGGGGGGGAEGA